MAKSGEPQEIGDYSSEIYTQLERSLQEPFHRKPAQGKGTKVGFFPLHQ